MRRRQFAANAARRAAATVAILCAAGAFALLAGCGDTTSTSSASTASGSSRAARQGSASDGGSSATSSAGSSQSAAEHLARVDIEVTSPASSGLLASRYTCDGADVPFPISWNVVPRGTVEQDLVIFSVRPGKSGKLTTVWAIAGLKPTVRHVSSAKLPSSVIVGRNSRGQTRYSLCPPRGKTEQYVALLYPLPRHVPVSSGFNARELWSQKLAKLASHEGQLAVSYERR